MTINFNEGSRLGLWIPLVFYLANERVKTVRRICGDRLEWEFKRHMMIYIAVRTFGNWHTFSRERWRVI